MADTAPTHTNLHEYVRVLGRRIHWLIAVVVLCVAVAFAISSMQTKQYSATTQLLVQPASGDLPISGPQATVSPTDVLTELQLVTSAPVNARATRKLGFSPNVTDAEVGQTNVIAITVTARSPIQAAHAANTYAGAFVSYEQANANTALTVAEHQLQSQINATDNELQTLVGQKNPSAQTSAAVAALSSQEVALKDQLAALQVSGAESPGGIEVISPAAVPTSPSSPRPVRDAVLALLLGLVLGASAAFAIEYFDNKVYSKDQVERLTGGVPVLALIPQVKGWKKRGDPVLITEVDPFSGATEAYRALRTSLQFAGHDGTLKTVLVTSPSGSEGKTSTVANLAMVLAQAGERVVVVGCDLRRPRIGAFLGRSEVPGFTSVLVGQAELWKAVQPVKNQSHLALLGSGPIPPNPAELLGSEKAAEIFRLLASGCDTVLIDSPPLLPVADAQVLAAYADAVLMVVTVGQTTEGEVLRATELLVQVDARPVGIVLNKVTHHAGSNAEYGLGYGYKYGYAPTRSPELVHSANGIKPAFPAQRSPRSQRRTVS
jgi:capsular exopolysaccharide synthesis family protein